MYKNFFSQDRGSIAIISAFLVVILLVVAGSAVDFIRYTTIRAEIQSSADSAVLAAASLSNRENPIDVAHDYFNTNFDESRFDIPPVDFVPVVVEDTDTSRIIRATASVEMPTLFLGLVDLLRNASGGLAALDIVVNTTAQESLRNLEMSLVLDLSNSMKGGGRIGALRTAAVEFVENIFATGEPSLTSVNIIPFSSNVNIEPILDDHVDLSGVPTPVARPCILYEAGDFTSGRITTLSLIHI